MEKQFIITVESIENHSCVGCVFEDIEPRNKACYLCADNETSMWVITDAKPVEEDKK